MVEGKRVAVVVPAHNEEELLPTTLASVPDFVDRIIVVDDASRDGTVGRAHSAAAVDPRIAVAVPCIGVQSFRWAIDNDSWQSRAGTFQIALNSAAKDAGAQVDAAFLRKFYDRVAPGVYFLSLSFESEARSRRIVFAP